jgi:hypothetical protein
MLSNFLHSPTKVLQRCRVDMPPDCQSVPVAVTLAAGLLPNLKKWQNFSLGTKSDDDSKSEFNSVDF